VVVTPNRTRMGLLIVLGAGFIVLGALNLNTALSPPSTAPCRLDPEPLPFGNVDRGWYVVFTCVFLGLGRIVGRWQGIPIFRKLLVVRGQPPAGAPVVGPSQRIRPGQLNSWSDALQANFVQLLVVVFISLAIFALAYETYGVANHNHPWPWTFFVRCINQEAGVQAFLTTLAIAFVIGSWFWPDRPSSNVTTSATPSGSGGTGSGTGA
jgi:hypothetical protein